MVEEKIKSTRYKYLDFLKILAIIMVVFYHSNGSYFVFPNNSALGYEFHKGIGCFLTVCVPIFFMVNGALLFNKELNIRKHLLKTIKTLFLIYFWSVILLLIQLPIREEHITLTKFLNIAFFLETPYVNHLWFLAQIVLLYLIFPFLKSLFDKDKRYFVLFTSIVFVFTIGTSILNSCNLVADMLWGQGNVLSKILNKGYSVISKYDPSVKRYSYSMVYFMFGGLLHYWSPKIKEKCINKKMFINILSVALICLLIYVSYLYVNKNNIHDPVWNGYSLIFTFLICCLMFVLGIINENEKQSNALNFLSSHTMGIYIIHFSVKVYVFELTKLIIDYNVFPVRWINIFLTLLISFILSFIISKIKFLCKTLKL